MSPLAPEPQPHIHLQPLTTHEQFDRCADLQDQVWGYEPAARVTQKVYLLASTIGGQVIGAYEGNKLVGYAMSLPGIRHGRSYLHSHHLAVLPAWRNQRVGQSLKLAQRDNALARGIELMEWTFDPLEIKNAHLNFARLGAISRRYRRDFYGASASPLQGGLPTDRMVAEWWLRSDRVKRVLAGEPAETATEHVIVPAGVTQWKTEPATRERARELQERNAAALEVAFARGLAVIGHTLDAEGNGTFEIGRCSEDLSYDRGYEQDKETA